MKTWWGKRSRRAKSMLGVSAGACVAIGISLLIWWLVTISKGITPWQIATEFVLPLLVASAGTAVAAAAWTTSRQAASSEELRLHREERTELAREMVEWAEIVILEMAARKDGWKDRAEALYGRITREAPLVAEGGVMLLLVFDVRKFAGQTDAAFAKARQRRRGSVGWLSAEARAEFTELMQKPVPEIGHVKRAMFAWRNDPATCGELVAKARARLDAFVLE